MSALNPHDLSYIVRRLPRSVRQALVTQPGAFLAGGFIRSCITGEKVNDVDLFSPSQRDGYLLALSVASGGGSPIDLLAACPPVPPQGKMDLGNRSLLTTKNAYTILGSKPTVQIIHRWTYQTVPECLESFDFTIAQAAIWYDTTGGQAIQGRSGTEHGGWRSQCAESYYADLAAKRLVYTSPKRNEDAGGSMLRVLRFYQRGYRIPLDSLAGVVARLTVGVDRHRAPTEADMAHVIRGLLFEVDPNAAIAFEETPAEVGASEGSAPPYEPEEEG